MPTIEDIANQLQTSLAQINTNTANTATTASNIKNDTAAIRTELTAVDAHLQSGVVTLGNGLFAILETQKRANSIAEHQSAQTDAMICWLDHAVDLLCGITRKLTREIEVQERMATSLSRLEGIAELVHAREAVEYDRTRRLEREIAECCPPEPRPEEPCPEPCRSPEPDFHKPEGQDWRPPALDSGEPQ